MTWIIDSSGPTADVIKAVHETEFDKFVGDIEERLAREKAQLTLAAPDHRPKIKLEIKAIEDELAKMDDAERELFDMAKSACVSILELVRTSHAGVCARPTRNNSDSPRGKTLSIHTSSYDQR